MSGAHRVNKLGWSVVLLVCLWAQCVQNAVAQGSRPRGSSRGGGGFRGGSSYRSRSSYSYSYNPHSYRSVGGSGVGGSGGFRGGYMGFVLLFVGMTMMVFICAQLCKGVAEASETYACSPPNANAYLAAAHQRVQNSTQSGVQSWPSGVWRGYYMQFDLTHSLCDFDLVFREDGRVSGKGADDVGHYRISGNFSGDRVAFTKSYIEGSRTAYGHVNRETNMGHSVHYRGKMVGDTFGQGFKGEWYIAYTRNGYRGKGRFHLWPAMPNWRQAFAESAPSAPGQEELVPFDSPPSLTPSEPSRFHVTRDNICIVCFDRPINTCLQPCQHVAVCSSCVLLLPAPRRCPICRSDIKTCTDSQGIEHRIPDGSPPSSNTSAPHGQLRPPPRRPSAPPPSYALQETARQDTASRDVQAVQPNPAQALAPNARVGGGARDMELTLMSNC
eukprot:TRINITY_DN9538_c0_g1_i2.p1 TRINITY_DN9538_c0_g1~~TRINITY_DN9538_c0_g1_i2.p1  ORF type:complete len:442 (+),score=19.65 TRINITY_DN9538_c0_g1_i2:120-1445(+)